MVRYLFIYLPEDCLIELLPVQLYLKDLQLRHGGSGSKVHSRRGHFVAPVDHLDLIYEHSL